MGIRLLSAILCCCLIATARAAESCQCLNGGTCSPQLPPRCLCPSPFLGKTCELPASEISNASQPASLSSNFSFFYFQPSRNIYYLLNFNICMLGNPSNVSTLVYIETEDSAGSLKAVPSLLKTGVLHLLPATCATFSTHYIEVKRRTDGSYHKIVMGMRLFDSDSDLEFVTLHPSPTALADPTDPLPPRPNTQSVLLSMQYEVYVQATFYETFLFLSAAFALMVLLSAFLAYLRRQNSLRRIDRTVRHLNRRHRALQRRRFLNPAEVLRLRRIHEFDIEAFMPTKRYRKADPASSTDLSEEGESCSICLLEFE